MRAADGGRGRRPRTAAASAHCDGDCRPRPRSHAWRAGALPAPVLAAGASSVDSAERLDWDWGGPPRNSSLACAPPSRDGRLLAPAARPVRRAHSRGRRSKGGGRDRSVVTRPPASAPSAVGSLSLQDCRQAADQQAPAHDCGFALIAFNLPSTASPIAFPICSPDTVLTITKRRVLDTFDEEMIKENDSSV